MADHQPSDDACITVMRRMGYNRKEFIRNFQSLARGQVMTVTGDYLSLQHQQQQLQVVFENEMLRNLGSLQIPSIQVTFRFYHYSSAEIEAFFKRFDLYFHRGGG